MIRMPALAVLAAALLPWCAQAASTRTHVSNAGNDANTSFSCDYAHPCRTFAAALGQTTAGGEILAIDSSGYGKVVVDRSVSIIAAPGVFAGVGVGPAGNSTGIEIATAGVTVVLRGLSVTGQGGDYGVKMTNGARLTIENCVFSAFGNNNKAAIHVNAPATVRVVDTLARDNYYGLWLGGGANAALVGVSLMGNAGSGLRVYSGEAGVTTMASVSEATVSGAMNGVSAGLNALANAAGATARIQVTRSAVSQADYGLLASILAGGTASVVVSESMLTGNAVGAQILGAGASVRSLGNNTFADNSTDVAGGSLAALGGM